VTTRRRAPHRAEPPPRARPRPAAGTPERGKGAVAHVEPGELTAVLARPLERALARGHPWIWRDAFRSLDARAGQVVTVLDRQARFVARGLCDAGPIGVRVLSTDAREPIDAALFERRMAAAAELRARVLPEATNAYRLLHGEGDRLPGVVCDVYGEHAVLKFDGLGALAWRETIERALRPVLSALGVGTLIVRSGRRGEEQVELGWGRLPEGLLLVEEHGMKLQVDPCRGQKTGLFLDHRASRWRVRALAQGAHLLNLYGYTGGFSIAAGLGGADQVDTVDLAAPALELAEQSWALNGLDPARQRVHARDAFDFLGQATAERRQWDLVVADPPSFAPKDASVPQALKSYRRLHEGCLRVLRPGGLYLAASCSSHVGREAFAETLNDAAAPTGRTLQLVDSWGAGPDHPRLLGFPEGDYLKVLLVRVLA
jgi:23S rRNA (cytosine1962-C5)-methyltransferase